MTMIVHTVHCTAGLQWFTYPEAIQAGKPRGTSTCLITSDDSPRSKMFLPVRVTVELCAPARQYAPAAYTNFCLALCICPYV